MRILVFQHVAVEHPGIFRDLWSEGGHSMDQIELDEGDRIPDMSSYDLLVAMGGPMDVWQEAIHPWLVLEKAAIRHWVTELKRPYLGICLGHQLLAEALGGKVTTMSRPEVGIAEVELTEAGRRDSILAGFGPRVETFQWHGAEVSVLPEGAEVLAFNEACAVQAMRWGAHAYGFQYHCEIIPTTVDEWERIPAYKASLVEALGKEKAGKLGEVVAGRLPEFRRSAEHLNLNLLKVIQAAIEPARNSV
jgi:GMP synthase-like glutamine amidotransferase